MADKNEAAASRETGAHYDRSIAIDLSAYYPLVTAHVSLPVPHTIIMMEDIIGPDQQSTSQGQGKPQGKPSGNIYSKLSLDKNAYCIVPPCN